MGLAERRSAEPARLGWIEASRGIAAIMVLVYHAVRHFDKNYGLPRLERAVHFGHAGVDLFFVISGFIILFVHYDDVNNPTRLKRYAQRRLTRILPAYWVAVVATIAITEVGGHAVPLHDIAWSIIPLPMFDAPLVDVAWTLQFECVFYVMFAVLILNRSAGIGLLLAWLAVIIFNAAWARSGAVPDALIGNFNLEFFAGMGVAYRLRQGPVRSYLGCLVVGAGLLVAIAIADDMAWVDGYGLHARLIYGLACTLLVLGAAEASRQSHSQVPNLLRKLGSASYSLYLFHFIIIGIVWKVLVGTGLAVTMGPIFGCTLAVTAAIVGGVAVSQFVEYPLMGLIRRTLREGRFAKPVPSASSG